MIYTITFNPAVDYVVTADTFRTGKTNRTKTENIVFGGKGVNVSLLLHALNTKSIALGFIAGFTGKALREGVEKEGITTDFIEVENGFTRINLKLHAEEETELNGSGPEISENELKNFFEKLGALTPQDTLVLSGSVPKSLPKDIYARIAKLAQTKGVRLIVDAAGDLLLSTLEFQPFLVKPNREELSEMFRAPADTEEQVTALAEGLKKRGAKNVLVSMAGDGALLYTETGEVYFAPAAKGTLINSTDSFLVALNAIMPTFLLLAFGYFLKHKNFVSSEFLKQTNTLTFKFFLPFLLFNNIYKTEITEAIDGMTFTIAVGSLLLLFAVLCVVVPRVVREPKQRGVIIQGLFRSNYVIFGVSLVTNVFGAEEAAAASILSAVLVPMYNVLAVIALTVFTGGGKVSLKKTLKSIATNPLIIAALLGVFASIIKLRFPAFLETSLRDVSRLATPLALIVLGGDFSFRKLKGNMRIAGVTVFIKLVVIPLVFLPIAVLAGSRGPSLLALALAWETPVAVSSYIMAQQAGADGELAGQLVVLSAVCCIPTVFLMIFILQSMALL